MHITSILLHKLQMLAIIYTSFFLPIHHWYNDTLLRFLFFPLFLDELPKISNLVIIPQYSTKAGLGMISLMWVPMCDQFFCSELRFVVSVISALKIITKNSHEDIQSLPLKWICCQNKSALEKIGFKKKIYIHSFGVGIKWSLK